MTTTTAPALSGTRIFHAEVVRVDRPNRHFVTVTIGGGDIGEFRSISPDQFVYVFVPRPGERDHRVAHDFSWDSWRELPEGERQVGRYYSVRAHDVERAEITLEFVVHGDGPLTTWASQASPGDKLALWGPRKAFDPPPDARSYLLFADETGLPALTAVVESLGADVTARAIIEVPDAEAEREFATVARLNVTWLHRDGLPAGETTLLSDAVRAVEPLSTPFYAWGAGEFRAMNSIRKHLREQCGLDAGAMSALAYWRHKDHAEDEGTKS